MLAQLGCVVVKMLAFGWLRGKQRREKVKYGRGA